MTIPPLPDTSAALPEGRDTKGFSCPNSNPFAC